MKATNDKKLEIAKEIVVAYIAHSPEQSRDVDAVVAATKKIFEAVGSLVETIEPPREPAGFRL